MVKPETGIEGFDELIDGGIESGSRSNLYWPPGTGSTVFTMQFLWEGETIVSNVVNKPFSHLKTCFKSSG